MSWPKKWNDTSLRDIATLPEFSRSRPWSLLGVLAIGLVAGAAIGGYAVSQRSQLKRLSTYAHRLGDELAAENVEAVKPVAVATSPRSNHRRKAAARI